MQNFYKLGRTSLLLAVVLATFAACQTPDRKPDARAATGSVVTLSGAEEVPPVSSSGAGTGIIRVAADRSVNGRVTISGVNATAAHIHQGAKGSNGPVILPLVKVGDSTFVVPENAKLSEEQYAHYRAGHLYINVHSSRYPNGEIRAQLNP